jgi:hypothetical protein
MGCLSCVRRRFRFILFAIHSGLLREEAWLRLSLFDRSVGRGVGGPGIVCARAYETVVVVLFNDVGCPSRDSADGEDGGEEIDVDTESGIGRG